MGFRLMTWGFGTGQLLGIYMLITNSDIQRTIYWKIIIAFIGIIIIGGFLKILHLKLANEILTIGMVGIVLTYLVRFINKKEKGLLDILKLLWVSTAYIIALLIILHYIPRREYESYPGILFWLMIIVFVILEFRKKENVDNYEEET